MENARHFRPGEQRRKRKYLVQREGRFRHIFKPLNQNTASETADSEKADRQKNARNRSAGHVEKSTSVVAKSTSRSLTPPHGRTSTGTLQIASREGQILPQQCSHRGPGRDLIQQPCIFCSSGLSLDLLDIEILDPFQTYPVRFAPSLVNWCDTYCLSILWPGLIPTSLRAKDKNKVAWSWLQLSRHDDALFTHFLFCAIFHHRFLRLLDRRDNGGAGSEEPLDAITNNRTNRILTQLYVECIKRVSAAVQNSSRASSDAIILSVGCLINDTQDPFLDKKKSVSPFQAPFQSLQWLDVYGYLCPNPVHWNGLVKLITLRGGLEKIELPALAALISYLDILTASKLLSHPKFPYSALIEDEDRVEREKNRISDIDRELAHLVRVGCTFQMVEVFQSAREYTSLLAAYERNTDAILDFGNLTDQRNMVQHKLLSLPSSEESDHIKSFRHSHPVYEVCRIAGLIFGIGVIFPLPSSMIIFPSLVQKLKVELLRERSFESRWCINEFVKVIVWSLMLGAIAASGLPERSWFISELSRVAAHARLSTWKDVKPILEEMLWLDSACDVAAQELWREVCCLFQP